MMICENIKSSYVQEICLYSRDCEENDYSMDYVYNIVNNVKYFYSSMNPAVLSGAIDVIVVEQPDGSYRSTPFHVRFGRYGVFNYADKYVDVVVNGVEIDLKMKLGENGVAFFVEANPDGERVPRHLATSPLPEDVVEERRKMSTNHLSKSGLSNDSQPQGGTVQRLVKRRHSVTNAKASRRRTLKHKRLVMRANGIYDGSYSDAELDKRLRTSSHDHHDTEWRWGEIPKTKKDEVVVVAVESTATLRATGPGGTSGPVVEMATAAAIVEPTDYLSDTSIDMIWTDYRRSLRLSSDQLRLLNLHYGSNEARFSITTKFQGTAGCSCHIYLLKWSEQLVISDIDGTITKSDVLGHVIPAIGGTWAHTGVAELYTRIKANGYRMIYLSSRAIGMSGQTKSYLKTVRQGTRTLPDGPVLLSPTSVLMALRKEVIERRPEEFKIACLTDLKSHFPGRQPFFAGFGNRITDVTSYRAVDIPFERILIINPSGVVTRADGSRFSSDYAAMANGSVDFMFPPLLRSLVERRRREEAVAVAAAVLRTVDQEEEEEAREVEWHGNRGSVCSEVAALCLYTQKHITKPEDIFLTSCSSAEHGAYQDGLIEDVALAEYAKRSAAARNVRKMSATTAGKK